MHSNIRRPLFDGMRLVHGIWFDLDLLGEQEARRRVLAHWQAGARLHLAGGGYLLSLAHAKFADCGRLDGVALCKVDQILSSAPLATDEKHEVPYGGCWLVRGAQAHAYQLADANRVDPAAWIDVGAIVLRKPLAMPASTPQVALGEPDAHKSLREILEDTIPPPSKQRDAFLRHVQAAKPSRAGGVAGAALAAGAAAFMGAGFLGLMLGRLFGGGGTGTGTGNGTGRQSGSGTSPATRAAPDGPWKQRLHAALASLAMFTKMSKLIGWRQAAYLRKMIGMFENGDIGEALRHAIPLDGQGDSQRQAFGTPRRRTSLDITPAGGTTSAIGMDGELQQYLRQSYRQLFTRLEREGRIDEATYVLAELLKSGLEAVDFLEKHGRLKQAAELAETLDLPAEVKVRLWFMAGNAERAVRIARLQGAFDDAVRRLEKHQHAQAGELRLEWATYLAERGDLAEAADAVWPLAEHRALALGWLLEAERAGRAPGARALARKLLLMPEALADSLPAINALLEAPDEDGAQLRVALAAELTGLGEQSTATSRLAGELLRHVLIDRSAGLNRIDKELVNKLMTISDAALLKSDLPPVAFTAPVRNAQLSTLMQPLQASGGAPGLLPIHDACRLPDGHYLLALGEGGVVRVNARGKQLVHFPLPAFHLVLARNGERALALARRGDMIRASRIDLTACTASDWISCPFDSWADHYDGLVWNAVIANRIVAIDTSKDKLAIIWQVGDLPGKIIDFLDNGATQTILIVAGEDLEQWRYDLPARRLSQRDAFAPPHEDFVKVMAHAQNSMPMYVRIKEDDSGATLLVTRPGGTQLPFVLGADNEQLTADIRDGWLVVHSTIGDGSFRCQVADRSVNKVVAELTLAHADHPRISANDNHLLMFDRAGRLVDIDCMAATVHSLTLS